MKKTIITSLIVFSLLKSNGQNGTVTAELISANKIVTDSLVVTMPAGKQFAASGWKQLWWGKHYRKEWIEPVSFSVLNMETFNGGLKPLKAGGGHESKTLRVQAGNGKEYVLRTIDKNLDVLIPEEFKRTFIADLVNDQICSAHPYGPLAIASLAEQLSFMHTNPIIIYVPDTPELGEFRPVFANKLCMLEERPSGKGWEHTSLTRDADEVINSEDLLEKVSANTKNQVDQKEFLKVRLFDMIVNDWDRHEDQWVWAAHEKGNKTIYSAFGRDRDQAFSKTDGIAIYLISRPWALRPLQNMTPTVKDLLGSNFSARNLDRQFLTELRKEDWEQAISFIQTQMTDNSIRQAVNTMPPEANKFSSDFVVKRLMQRRDNLSGYGMKYYSILNKRVTVAGSEKKEEFIVDNINENEIAVTGLQQNRDTFFHRVFYRNETKEINLYGVDGDDQFTFTGNGKNSFVLRIIGGNGNNSYTNTKSSGEGKRIRIYDSLYNQGLPRKMFRVNKKSDSLYRYKRAFCKYDWYIPIIVPGYNPDDGVSIGLGFLYRKQQWGKPLFGWQQRFSINYAAATGALGFGYRGIFKQTFGKLDFDLHATYKGPRFILNYYGLGNNTTLDSNSKSFYRVKARILMVSPGVSRSWKNSSFRTGLLLQSVNVLKDQNKFITSPNANIDPSVFALKYYGGANGELIISTTGSERNPEKGINFKSAFSYLHELKSPSRNVLELNGSFAFYLTLANTLTFAHRTGAETNFGEYDFYYANGLGGNENLRGYWRDRFAGRTSFYQNTELRCKLAKLKGYVFRGQLGLIGFIDDGRVWEKNETSSTIHVGYGGGLYFLPFNALALNLYYASSKEVDMIVLKAGFFF